MTAPHWCPLARKGLLCEAPFSGPWLAIPEEHRARCSGEDFDGCALFLANLLADSRRRVRRPPPPPAPPGLR